ncbi:proline-rich protein 4-like [Oryza brachyantha]|uniref:proline-rich protein 4-like n=1 Tax=Oryza brachyantha TaxID=4533 RepID=UPI001ADAB115|nr:proline-rich protein 4-like [Oryza brachyantha]
MAAAPRGLVLLGVCAAVLMAFAVHGEAASVVVGTAKCADCTRKNMKAEDAFKGLQVAIKCKNSNGEYESKAAGKLDGTGAFSVPLDADLHSSDCVAQLHTAANEPCPGQEPSKIVPQSEGTFVAVAGKTHYPSALCSSAAICGPIKKKIMDHFHKKPVPPKPEPKPEPPKPKPEPEHPFLDHIHKKTKHFFDHFHKKPVPPKPEPNPETKPQPKPQPAPEYHNPTPPAN